MEGPSLLIWGIMFGAIGLGFFTYGRRQKAVVPLVTGIALFVFPYFMPNVYMLVITGAVLVALPYFVRI
jgi:predicted membrane protein